jgi:signal transduction histidine kinase
MCLLGVAAVVLVRGSASLPVATQMALAAVAAGGVVVVVGAFVAADGAARLVDERVVPEAADGWVAGRVGDMRSLNAAHRDAVQQFLAAVKRGEKPEPPGVGPAPDAPADSFPRLAHEMASFRLDAQRAIAAAAGTAPGGGSRRDVYVTLGLRMQSLVNRAIVMLDELEKTENPALLDGLFAVDHLITRLRRQCESLAVLGGGGSRRQWSAPVELGDVLRSAVAEIEHYSRVQLGPYTDCRVDGRAAADVLHMIAELLDNATRFSPPDTQVQLRTEIVPAGLAIDVVDRGVGIVDPVQRHRINEVLADPRRVDVAELLSDGRIGLYVVAELARRHGARVELQASIYGGAQAAVLLPPTLIRPAAEQRADEHLRPAPALPAAALSAPTAASPASQADHPRGRHATPQPDAADPAVNVTSVNGARKPAQILFGPGADPGPAGDRPSQASDRTPDRTPSEVSGGERPRPALPKRRAQANLPPELVGVPACDEGDLEPMPGLIAAFQDGIAQSGPDPTTRDHGG